MLPGWTGLFASLNPDESRTGWQIARNTSKSFYEWFDDPAHAKEAHIIHKFFQMQFQNIPSWLDGIDFQSTYANSSTSSDVVFVDVGGGNGQECEKLRAKTPNLVGRVIHQDLAGVLERAPSVEGVEKMVHDYFTPQKVEGAPSLRPVIATLADILAQEHESTISGKSFTTTLTGTVLPYFEITGQQWLGPR